LFGRLLAVACVAAFAEATAAAAAEEEEEEDDVDRRLLMGLVVDWVALEAGRLAVVLLARFLVVMCVMLPIPPRPEGM